MKKVLLSLFVIAAFVAYSWHARNEQNSATVTAPTSLTTSNTTTTQQTTTSGGAGTGNSNASAGAYKDGSYTGSVADATYGNIQVQVTISGGKITDVAFLQYPNDQSHSIRINQQAMPYLKQEAIQAQSAQVDGVSGATLTSQAFIESLGSALNQAKA